jgi:hypothetical protein
MEWTVVLAGPARKALKRVPQADRSRIEAALAGMVCDPFHGDIRKVNLERRHIVIAAIERRTSTTY